MTRSTTVPYTSGDPLFREDVDQCPIGGAVYANQLSRDATDAWRPGHPWRICVMNPALRPFHYSDPPPAPDPSFQSFLHHTFRAQLLILSESTKVRVWIRIS